MAFTKRQLYGLPLRPVDEVVNDWILLMAATVGNCYLEKDMPDHLKAPLQPYDIRFKIHCHELYNLCVKAQDGYFEQSEWVSSHWCEYYFDNIRILLGEAYVRARRERNKDRWVVIPDINTPDFYVMMSTADRNVNAKKDPWGINSNIYNDPDLDESMELSSTFFQTSMERPYRRPANRNQSNLQNIPEESGETSRKCEIL